MPRGSLSTFNYQHRIQPRCRSNPQFLRTNTCRMRHVKTRSTIWCPDSGPPCIGGAHIGPMDGISARHTPMTGRRHLFPSWCDHPRSLFTHQLNYLPISQTACISLVGLAKIMRRHFVVPPILAAIADRDTLFTFVDYTTDPTDPSREVDSYRRAWWNDDHPVALSPEDIRELWKSDLDDYKQQVCRTQQIYDHPG